MSTIIITLLGVIVYISIVIITILVASLVEAYYKKFDKPDFDAWIGLGILWPIAFLMGLFFGIFALIVNAPQWIYDNMKDK